MKGDQRVRFCDQCKLNVYNLSEMSRPAAERLVLQTEGRLCVRYYQRADGTMGNALQVPWADYQAWLADSKTHPEIPAGSIPAKYAQDIGLTCDNLPGYTDSGKKVDEQGTLPNDQTGPLEGAIYPYWVKA